MKPIPIAAAGRIAKQYGYDQVIIVARKVGDGGGEHCTTYGVNKENCDIAARIGDFLKFKIMGWAGREECRHCGTWFESGPGAGRRRNSKFCSDEHRIAFNSLKRNAT